MEISKEERELYDRQIRLWGIEGQKTLRNARILVIGFEAVAVEVAKNLCLAGVGSLTLQSTQKIKKEDMEYNFFIRSNHIDENAVVASQAGVQKLNPNVVVATETRPISELDDNFFSSFQVVIITQVLDKQWLIHIDEVCRGNNSAFYYCNHHGWGGIFFVDLGKVPHKFIVEKEVLDKVSKCEKTSATQEIVHVKPPAEGSSKEKLTIQESYCSLEAALKASQNFSQSLKARQRAKVSPYLPAYLSLLDSPEKSDIEGYAEKLGLQRLKITDEFKQKFLSLRGVQVSAIASVVGGLLSQEVLNYLTAQDYPVQNIFIYDAEEGKGPVYYLNS